METSYTSSVGDDFDVYFKRAAQLQLQPQLHHLTTPIHHHHHDRQRQQQKQQQQTGCRRVSAPQDRRSSSSERHRAGSSSRSVRHKRTSSCRYPQRGPTVTVTCDVTVTHDQLVSPNEHTPLTADCQRARLNDHRQLGEWSLYRPAASQLRDTCSSYWLTLLRRLCRKMHGSVDSD